jgi:hypothetical protein
MVMRRCSGIFCVLVVLRKHYSCKQNIIYYLQMDNLIHLVTTNTKKVAQV